MTLFEYSCATCVLNYVGIANNWNALIIAYSFLRNQFKNSLARRFALACWYQLANGSDFQCLKILQSQ